MWCGRSGWSLLVDWVSDSPLFAELGLSLKQLDLPCFLRTGVVVKARVRGINCLGVWRRQSREVQRSSGPSPAIVVGGMERSAV